jgi:hypothetical protein
VIIVYLEETFKSDREHGRDHSIPGGDIVYLEETFKSDREHGRDHSIPGGDI